MKQQIDRPREHMNLETWLDLLRKSTLISLKWFLKRLKICISAESIQKRSKRNFYLLRMTILKKILKRSRMDKKTNSIRRLRTTITISIKTKMLVHRRTKEPTKLLICRNLWVKLDQLWNNVSLKVKSWVSWNTERRMQVNVMLLKHNLTLSFITNFSISMQEKMDSLQALKR